MNELGSEPIANLFEDCNFQDIFNKSYVLIDSKGVQKNISDFISSRPAQSKKKDNKMICNTKQLRKAINWDIEMRTIVPIVCDLYYEHPTLQAMSEEEKKKLRVEQQIFAFYSNGKSTGTCCPIYSFDVSSFPSTILNIFETLNIKTPTPIQMQIWPLILSGKSVIGISSSKSGKTLGYGIPAIMHTLVNYHPSQVGPKIVIIARTLESAHQIADDLRVFAAPFEIRVGVLSKQLYTIEESMVELHDKSLDTEENGPNIPSSIKSLLGSHGVRALQSNMVNHLDNDSAKLAITSDIAVATVGTLLACIKHGSLLPKHASMLIIDDAPLVLQNSLQELLFVDALIRPDRQLILMGSNWDIYVDDLENGLSLSISSQLSYFTSQASRGKKSQDIIIVKIGKYAIEKPQYTHYYFFGTSTYLYKRNLLIKKLREVNKKRVLIFTSSIETTEEVRAIIEDFLHEPALVLHSSLSATARKYTIEKFSSPYGTERVLVCTDCASAGLNFDNLSVVINFDIPITMVTFLNRCARIKGTLQHNAIIINFIPCSDRCFILPELIDFAEACDFECGDMLSIRDYFFRQPVYENVIGLLGLSGRYGANNYSILYLNETERTLQNTIERQKKFYQDKFASLEWKKEKLGSHLITEEEKQKIREAKKRFLQSYHERADDDKEKKGSNEPFSVRNHCFDILTRTNVVYYRTADFEEVIRVKSRSLEFFRQRKVKEERERIAMERKNEDVKTGDGEKRGDIGQEQEKEKRSNATLEGREKSDKEAQVKGEKEEKEMVEENIELLRTLYFDENLRKLNFHSMMSVSDSTTHPLLEHRSPKSFLREVYSLIIRDHLNPYIKANRLSFVGSLWQWYVNYKAEERKKFFASRRQENEKMKKILEESRASKDQNASIDSTHERQNHSDQRTENVALGNQKTDANWRINTQNNLFDVDAFMSSFIKPQ